MTAREYLQNSRKGLEEQLEKVNYDIKTKNGFYNFGIVAGILAGIICLTSSPWFAVPVFGGVASCLMGKNLIKKTLGSKKQRLEGELNHLNGVASKGLDTRPETDKKRKTFLDSLKGTREKQEAAYNDANHHHRVIDALLLGTSFAAVWFPGPILACLPVACLIGKYFNNQELGEAQEALEATAHRMNNVANDFNMSVYTNQEKRKNAQKNAPVAQQQKTAGKTTSRVQQRQVAPQPKKTYSAEDERAVDEYLRQMSQNSTPQQGVQKRKI